LWGKEEVLPLSGERVFCHPKPFFFGGGKKLSSPPRCEIYTEKFPPRGLSPRPVSLFKERVVFPPPPLSPKK